MSLRPSTARLDATKALRELLRPSQPRQWLRENRYHSTDTLTARTTLTNTHSLRITLLPPHHRTFSTTLPLLKHGGKQNQKHNIAHAESVLASSSSPSSSKSSSKSSSTPEKFDPLDFSILQAEIDRAVEKLKDELKDLRGGGRVTPEVLGRLMVRLKTGPTAAAAAAGEGKAGKKGKSGKGAGEGAGGKEEGVRLGSIAQVVPRGGRGIVVLVGEAEYIKPITTTLLQSPYSLTPQPDPHNSLQLNISLPPPTAESRQSAIKDAKAAGERANFALREARGAHNKKLRAAGLARVVGPDEGRRAQGKMEEVVKRGEGRVKEAVEGGVRAIGG
ncbi:MAG: hypothetical protein M1834_002479 [Cirrosporium novae-zelandiae]|nr:MAG: hypothetical protein M1834_002479 [Cirrosporium novae-zelandiae]